MVTEQESRLALRILTADAVAAATGLVASSDRAELLVAVPELVDYFTDGSAALAADFYDEERDRARAPGDYAAQVIVLSRWEKFGRAVSWATEPLLDGDQGTASARLAEVVQLEVARPYRDTIVANKERDPEAVGWRRVARSAGCKLCRMLADRGAVYRHDTARFAAHGNCNCTAQPVFSSNDTGDEASVMQYLASRRRRSAAERARLRDYLNENYPDVHG